jgi:alpha-glucosidase
MCDRPFTLANCDEILDITAFNYGDKHVEEKVRDCQRTPMQWTNQTSNAGFTSDTTKPYLPLADTWRELNVEQQQNASRSHLKLFQQLVKLRRQSPFYGGQQKKVIATKELYAFLRWLETSIYLIVININKKGHDPVTTDFHKLLKCQNKELIGEVIARSCNVLENSPISQEGNQINLNKLTMQSSEAVLLRLLMSPNEIPFCQS